MLIKGIHGFYTWWLHQMETCSALLALRAGNSPVTGEFPSQRPVTQSFDVLFHLCPNIWLSKQSRRRWLETPSCSLWRHCNGSLSVYRWFRITFVGQTILFKMADEILRNLTAYLKLTIVLQRLSTFKSFVPTYIRYLQYSELHKIVNQRIRVIFWRSPDLFCLSL